MITTRIEVKPHLKEYLLAKYGRFPDERIRFPDSTDIYHQIFDLTEKRPAVCGIDSGNLEIVLPDRKSYKHPKTYNYLGVRSQRMIGRKIEDMFWVEFREFIEHEHRIE